MGGSGPQWPGGRSGRAAACAPRNTRRVRQRSNVRTRHRDLSHQLAQVQSQEPRDWLTVSRCQPTNGCGRECRVLREGAGLPGGGAPPFHVSCL
ncbi:hypothetical protein NDU88_005355 [Pleurodeles waltl]|uniref:Uncharacterized protein n=1 Tax=Pleurodeles waltl TaxID=8319 RepID=A0AAV7MA97_PLEWA|nr:hypothetical protein NDU88_005355 [Pleurodeles waltl]